MTKQAGLSDGRSSDKARLRNSSPRGPIGKLALRRCHCVSILESRRAWNAHIRPSVLALCALGRRACQLSVGAYRHMKILYLTLSSLSLPTSRRAW